MLVLYGHCPNSFRPPPQSNGQTWKKVPQTILASPYTPGQHGKKVPKTMLETTHFIYLTNPPVPERSNSLDIPQLYIAINLAKILKEETPEYLKCIKTLLFRVFFSSYSISFGATFPIPPPTGHCKSAWMPSKLPQKFNSKSPQNLSCAVSKTQLWLLTPRYMGSRHFYRLRFHAQKFKERIWKYKKWNILMPPVLIQFY